MPDPYDEAIATARAMQGPLDARLAVLRAACRTCEPAYAATVDRLAERLRGAALDEAAPPTGAPMPGFLMPDQDGRLWSLRDCLSGGPLVLVFLRGFWCDFCDLTLLAMAELAPRLRACGAAVAAVAPQRAAFGAAHRRRAGAAFPMLVDLDGGHATGLGLTTVLDAELAGQLKGFGIDLATIQGDGGQRLAIPAVFVLDRAGRIVARQIEPDPRWRMEPEAILQALEAA